jgi:DNA-binding LacI/PurR family transcriptional regulator
MIAHNLYDPLLAIRSQTWEPDAMFLSERFSEWATTGNMPTALFCATDDLALNMITIANDAGVRVPEDLSIMGIDNRRSGAESNPSLTTIDVPVEEIGRQAVHALTKMMAGEPAEECRIMVPVSELVVRSSTMVPR